MRKPLEGIRILDFTQFMAGPYCTLLLSDFGAEVIKIENPPKGDATRYGNALESGCSSHYATRNRGKKSVVLDMKDARQKELFLKLVKTADAVVENYKPGTMESFGITYELLEEINPRIVYTSISGYGQEGPYARRGAFDATIQAESGIMSVTGEEGGRPTKSGAPVADYTSGLCGCIGTLMGIVDAQRTGHGRRVDVSMLDTMIFMQENMFSLFLKNHVVPVPNGNRYPTASPIRDFVCRDGISVMLQIATDEQWKNFADALHQPQWLTNPHFATMALRSDHYREVEEEVQRVIGQMDSKDVTAVLDEKKCVYGSINDYAAVENHPQVTYRKTIVEAVYPNGVSFRVPGNPIQMSGMERQMSYPAAELGKDTYEILQEVADADTVHAIMEPTMEKIEHYKK